MKLKGGGYKQNQWNVKLFKADSKVQLRVIHKNS